MRLFQDKKGDSQREQFDDKELLELNDNIKIFIVEENNLKTDYTFDGIYFENLEKIGEFLIAIK